LVEGTRVTKLAKKYPRGVLIEDARAIDPAVHHVMPGALENPFAICAGILTP